LNVLVNTSEQLNSQRPDYLFKTHHCGVLLVAQECVLDRICSFTILSQRILVISGMGIMTERARKGDREFKNSPITT